MATHYRKTRKLYIERKKTSKCPFCDISKHTDIMYQNEHIFVVPNLTKYDIWELHDVKEHLLIMPKRHVCSLKELNDAEMLAIMKFAAEYEDRGFSIYARGVGFVRRSVEHQHTHLIRVDNKNPKFSLFLRKPYILLKK